MIEKLLRHRVFSPAGRTLDFRRLGKDLMNMVTRAMTFAILNTPIVAA